MNDRNLKKRTKLGELIYTVLSLFILANSAIALADNVRFERGVQILHVCSDIVMIFAVLYYTFIGYKKPHGNMLRAVFFCFGVYLALNGSFDLADGEAILFYSGLGEVFSALLLTYIAGRLDKIEKNKFLLIIVGVIQLICSTVIAFYLHVFQGGFSASVSVYTMVTGIALLGYAYTARYEVHKAAGLEDAD